MERIEALEDAIQKKSLVGIYSVFYTIAHGDPNFSTGKFMEALAYVKSKNIEGLMQEFDGDDFEDEEKWDEEYWAYIASTLMDNFCMERIEHLKKVGRKVYPVKSQANFVSNNMTSQSSKRLIGPMGQERATEQNRTRHTNITEEERRRVRSNTPTRVDKIADVFINATKVAKSTFEYFINGGRK